MKRSYSRIAVIGAGSVGSTLAMRIVEDGLADVVLIDIFGNAARGKAMDILDSAPIMGHEQNIHGTEDYAEMRGADIVVVTAGFPRKPGMTREELTARNAAVVKDVSLKIKTHAPSAVVIMVTNPLDAMTYLALRTTGFKRNRVMGMAGVLDGSRFVQLIASELKVPRSAVTAFMLGSHGDTMVPALSCTRVSGKPIGGLLPPDKLAAIVKRARERGAEIVSLLGTGSAYYSPSGAVLKMARSILRDSREEMVVSASLDGEYGLSGLAIGVPCVIGKNGIEKIIQLKLTEEEKDAFAISASAIKGSIAQL